MAERLRYVNLASTAGGNGTTNSTTIGDGNRAYSTIVEGVAAEAANLSGAGDTLRFVCEGTTSDAPVSIVGYTTSSTCFITIEVAAGATRHAGVLDTGKYRIADAGAVGYHYDIQEDFVRFRYLQGTTVALAGVTYVAFQIRNITSGTNLITIHGCITRANLTGSGGADGECIYAGSTDANVDVTSCTFYDWINGTNTCYGGMLNRGAGTVRFSDVTITNSRRAIRNCIGKGVLAQGTDSGSVYVNNTLTSCASNDTSANGTNPVISATYTFANEAGDDYHLSTSDAYAYHAGIDLSADTPSVTEDIDGETISTNFNIGSDWTASGGGATNAGFRSLLGVGK